MVAQNRTARRSALGHVWTAIVLTSPWTAPLNVVCSNATTLWHFDAAEWAPSTASNSEELSTSICFRLYPQHRTLVGAVGTSHLGHDRKLLRWKQQSPVRLRFHVGT